VRLVFVLGYALQRFDEAELRAEEAQAMIGRVRRHDPRGAEELQANLDEARGQIELRHHRYEAAVALYERSLAVVERRAGPDGLRVAQALNALASAHLAQRQWDEARALFERVLSIRTKQLGPAHPEIAQTRNNLGLALKNAGKLDEAAAQLEDARTLVIASLGATHPSRRMVDMNLAEVYYLQERHDEAADLYTLAFGPEGVGEIGDQWTLRRAVHYGISLVESGRLSQAREVLGLAHTRAGDLDDSHAVRVIQVKLAHVELELGRPALALALLDRLAPPSSEPDVLAGDVGLVRACALASLGRREEARELLPVLAGIEGKPAHAESLARLQVLLDE
jgi:tetratricopeptide (TPR) repeat protein